MATVTMSHPASGQSSSSKFAESDLSRKLGNLKFNERQASCENPPLIVCEMSDADCHQGRLMDKIERSPSTASLSVPSVDTGTEKRPPLPKSLSGEKMIY